jgi:hypothetical protein
MTPDEFHTALHVDLGKPQVEVRTRTAGKFVYKEIVKEPGAHRASWALASVTLSAHSIKVQINLNLKKNDLSAADYLRLKGLALQGIRTYWSRSIKVRNELFSVDVNAIQATSDAVGVDLYLEKGTDYARSSNLAILGRDASLFYNAGYFSRVVDADQDFMLTAAHEFGHSVLMEFRGLWYSWTHEGSTSIFQATTSSTPGYPSTGEIDLMRYYDDKKASASPTRLMASSRANEFDVKCLLWMSKLTF